MSIQENINPNIFNQNQNNNFLTNPVTPKKTQPNQGFLNNIQLNSNNIPNSSLNNTNFNPNLENPSTGNNGLFGANSTNPINLQSGNTNLFGDKTLSTNQPSGSSGFFGANPNNQTLGNIGFLGANPVTNNPSTGNTNLFMANPTNTNQNTVSTGINFTNLTSSVYNQGFNYQSSNKNLFNKTDNTKTLLNNPNSTIQNNPGNLFSNNLNKNIPLLSTTNVNKSNLQFNTNQNNTISKDNPLKNINTNLNLADSKNTITKINNTIYPNNKIQINLNNPVTFESNLESRKNILGISRNEISNRVIDAISKNMTIKEFFLKASEEISTENQEIIRSKSKRNLNNMDIYDIGLPKSNYIDSKLELHYHRENLKEKFKLGSKININEENYKKKNEYEYGFTNKPVGMIHQRIYENKNNNFNQNNFNMISLMNDNFTHKSLSNTEDYKNLNQADIKKSLVTNEVFDLYDPLLNENKEMLNFKANKKFNISFHKLELETYKSDEINHTTLNKNLNEIETNNKNKSEKNKIIKLIAEIKNKDIFISFQAHRDCKVSVLKGYIIEKLFERNSSKISNISNNQIIILFKSSILIDDKLLNDYEFSGEENNIVVIITDIDDYSRNINKKSSDIRKEGIQSDQLLNSEENLTKINKLERPYISRHLKNKPKNQENAKLTNLDYFPKVNDEFDINPCISYIYRMTEKELKNVNNFKISNKFGKIKFLVPVDLAFLNFNDVISITSNSVQIYPGQELPEIGQGLNKPAVITVKNLFEMDDKLSDLKEFIKNKGKFLKYNSENGKFKFQVDKWSK